MKKVLLMILVSLFSATSQATVDANARVFIIVKHIQSEEFFIERAPIIGCYGLPKGPELAQLTKPYVVSNLGCGMDSTENINALTCAKVTDFVEADDFSTFKEITLDISKCEDKNNAEFIKEIKRVVRLNFATKTVKKPKLKIIK